MTWTQSIFTRRLPYSQSTVLSGARSSLSVVVVVILQSLLHVSPARSCLAVLFIAARVVIPRPLLLVDAAALALPLAHSLIVDSLASPADSRSSGRGGRRQVQCQCRCLFPLLLRLGRRNRRGAGCISRRLRHT
ncbi:hypothetical protein PMAYCL1PPCAC_06238, partial [Pristionchus mayeri]